MNIKSINYIFILIISLFIMMGCGGATSSDNQSNPTVSEEEKVAIFIPQEKLNTQSKISVKQIAKSSNASTSKVIKEDAENAQTDKWIVYDRRPSGAYISNVFDYEKLSQVIQLTSSGLQNGFALGMWAKGGKWNDREHKSIQWSMNFNESFIIYVRVNTTDGYRYLYYTASDYNYGLIKSYDAPHYIHHGLGSDVKNGGWRTFTRNIEADLKEFDPTNELVSIDGFFVRGSGKIDDVALVTESSSLTIDASIDKWLTSQSLFRNLFVTTTISPDKTRAIVYADEGYPNTDGTYILDISNLNNIREIAKRAYYRYNYPKDVKIKEGEYIILARSTEFLIYDYTTGELLSKFNSHDFTGMNYLLITDNYAISTQSSVPFKSILIKLDFSDRKNPISTTLYTGDLSDKYSLAPDGSSVLVEDKKGFTYIDNIHPNTRFDAFYNPVATPGSAFTSTLSKNKNKLFILSADEGSYVKLQIIDLTTLQETNIIDVSAFVLILSSYPPIYLSTDGRQLIIPKEYRLGEENRGTDIIVDLP